MLFAANVIFASLLPVGGTLLMLWQARQERMFNNHHGAIRWLAGGLACAVASGTILFFMFSQPNLIYRQTQSQYGFGPGWSCQYVARVGPICFRDPVKPK